MTDLFLHTMPGMGFLGGLLIGTSAALMLLGLGRIAGISGLFAQATGVAKATGTRWIPIAFLAGLPLGAFLVSNLRTVEVTIPTSLPILITGGLLVGFGTRLASGCTSGHGVCGLSRLSPRSIVATLSFMLAGFVTVAIMRTAGWL